VLLPYAETWREIGDATASAIQVLREHGLDYPNFDALMDIWLQRIERGCVEMDFVSARKRTVELRSSLEASQVLHSEEERATHVEALVTDFVELEKTISHELEERKFFYVRPVDCIALYENAEPFGSIIHARFKKADRDICEAAKCLAFSRHTACVLHLARVLEAVFQFLAKSLKVSLVGAKGWGDCAGRLRGAVNAYNPQNVRGKQRKRKLQRAITHLDVVREAWRNDAIHSFEVYDETDARTIYENTKAFMGLLAG
jgi:hypothetical protein